VVPAYSVNGANWMDYVENDGADVFSASDTACTGSEVGYDACIHGGEIRKVVVAGVASCTDLSLSDVLSAFQWTCVVKNGGAAPRGRRGVRDDGRGWRGTALVNRPGIAVNE
jgi:hypothetical protein